MADLLTAIGTLATKLIPNSTGDKRRTYVARLADYSHRLLFAEVPQLALEKAPDEATVPDLSPNANVAEVQILTALGFDTKQAIDPSAVVKAASPDQNRELALLGFFGSPTHPIPGADYSLFTRYYEESPVGLTPDGQPTEGNWVLKDPSTSPWTAWQAGQ